MANLAVETYDRWPRLAILFASAAGEGIASPASTLKIQGEGIPSLYGVTEE